MQYAPTFCFFWANDNSPLRYTAVATPVSELTSIPSTMSFFAYLVMIMAKKMAVIL
jgi:hypothetical protein